MATKSIYKSRMPFKGVFGFFCGEHMAITIPETEPLDFYSGETVKWKRTDLSDYPAPTWTLYYVLQKTGTRITFNSSQDGSTTSHLISLTPNYHCGGEWCTVGDQRHRKANSNVSKGSCVIYGLVEKINSSSISRY